jgi:hypothetical protein
MLVEPAVIGGFVRAEDEVANVIEVVRKARDRARTRVEVVRIRERVLVRPLKRAAGAWQVVPRHARKSSATQSRS